MIEPNETIRRNFASRIVRRLHWLFDRAPRTRERKQKSSRQTRGQKGSARHSFEAFLRKCHTTLLRLTSGSCLLDRSANTYIGSTTADISRHRGIDIGIIGIDYGGEQGRCSHDLARLAIAALDHFKIKPGLLHFRAGRRPTDAFDCGHAALPYPAHRHHARAHRLAVDVHGACAALRYAATKLRSGQTEDVTKHPEQPHVGA